MEKLNKNIIDVIPLTRIPLDKSPSFSYLHSQKISPGTLVSIPLFRRNIEGIVVGSRNDFHRLGNIELKKINKIVEENFLTEKQIRLAEFISNYYFSPLGTVLKFFIPKRIKARKQIARKKAGPFSKKITLTKEQRTAVDEITKNQKLKFNSFLLYGPASSGKTEVYINSILEIKARDPQAQFLILLPELTLTPQAIERYSEYFHSKEIAVLHSKISKGQFYADWQKIKSGEAKIIIGSRMAIFAPFKKLGLVVIDEEQDMSFKQWDMNPRYDARIAAEKLSELHNCKAIFGSATPRVEDYWKAMTKKYGFLKLPILSLPGAKDRRPDTKIELVDMKKERWGKNYSPISKKLKSELAYALKNKLQAILFINRQGMSSFSICAQCKNVLRCPKCQRALVYDTSGIYRCIHCSHKTSIMPSCSKCKSITFTNIGLGTQKIEREILSMFPGASVARADNQTMRTPHAQEILYEKLKRGEIDILIGTQIISKGWDLPNVSLVGIIDGDGMLSIPDFSAEEKAFQSLVQVSGRTGRLGAKFPGLVLIQTFHPEQDFFKNIAEKKSEGFYAKELKDRKNLKLPPFGKIIKLIFQDYNRNKSASETSRVFALLNEKLDENITISEPQDSFVSNVRGRFRRQIIIKIAGNKEISASIANTLKSLPSGWIIDIDPISII